MSYFLHSITQETPMSTVHSSVILQTRDNKLYIVPKSLLTYWELFSSLEEAVGNNDDVIPIPLTSVQTDIWIDLTIRLEVDWMTIGDKKEYNLYLLPQNEVVPIARSMDAKNTDWYLYCDVDTDGSYDELKLWYQEVGKLSKQHDISWIMRYNSEWCNILIHDLIRKCRGSLGLDTDWFIAMGIIYASMLKANSLSLTISWLRINWNMILRLNVWMALFESGQKGEMPLVMYILCYDGINDPPTPSYSDFKRESDNVIYEDNPEEYEEMYQRIMRCVIAVMEEYPEHIADVAKRINICGTSLLSRGSDGSYEHLMWVETIHDRLSVKKSVVSIIYQVGEMGARLYKKAKMMYLENELKKCKEMEI